MEGGARLVVEPGAPLSGRFRPPGDKSITHRGILLGLLAEGVTRIEAPNPGADCEASLECARLLGARVTRAPGAFEIEGAAGRLTAPARVLDCGNSGTTLRLLAGVLAAHPFTAELTGDDSLRGRPVARIVEPLRRMGATLTARDGDRYPPLTVRGAALRPAAFTEPTASAQVATTILFAGLQASGRTSVRILPGVRDHTLRMLPAFGVPLEVEVGEGGVATVTVEGPRVPRAASFRVPGDFSAAAFFLAAAAATPGARVVAEDVSLNPTRTGLLDALLAMGAGVERRVTGLAAGEPVGEVIVTGPPRLEAVDLPPASVPAMVDEIPAWAIAAAAAIGTSRVAGAGELRVKESDRLAAIARNLAALGIACEERPDGLAITGGHPQGGRVEAHGDHRIAMAFALLGVRASGPVTIDDASSIATSFPGFATTLAALGGRMTSSSRARS